MLDLEYKCDSFQGCTIYDISDIEAGVNCLKNGKACGYDGISRENIVYSHPALIVHLKLLFNLICEHGFVPDNLGYSVIVKDRLGDICSTDNYRPATLSPVLSNVFLVLYFT